MLVFSVDIALLGMVAQVVVLGQCCNSAFTGTKLLEKLWPCPGSHACMLSCVPLFVTPWTVARQAPVSMGFSRREYWCGLPFPSPGDLPDPGIEAMSYISCYRWATREDFLEGRVYNNERSERRRDMDGLWILRGHSLSLLFRWDLIQWELYYWQWVLAIDFFVSCRMLLMVNEITL